MSMSTDRLTPAGLLKEMQLSKTEYKSDLLTEKQEDDLFDLQHIPYHGV